MRLPSISGAQPRQEYPDGWSPGDLPQPSRRPRGDAQWSIVAVAVAAIVALTAVVVVAGNHADSAAAQSGPDDRGGEPSNALPEAPASAADTGPIAIITDDQTCGDWKTVQNAVTVARRTADWDQRDPRIPASSLTPGQRAELTGFGDALRARADATVALAARTPHREMRGLYLAFIAYGRAYVDALPNYQPPDDDLAQASLAASDALTRICGATQSKVASAQEPRLAPVAGPSAPPLAVDLSSPEPFLPQPNRICQRWVDEDSALQARIRPWSTIDPDLAVGQLDGDQIRIYADTARTMNQFAARTEPIGRGSGNPTWEDFATLGALYFRAYSQAVPLIWAGDHDMAWAALAITRLVSAGCRATATV